MQNLTFKHTKKYCYFTYLAMSSVFSLPPLLFATFKETYGISYTLLGTLVLINFCTQLGIDLIFSFLSKHFNIRLTVRIMPLITATGLGIYALTPTLFPEYAYAGLITGTFIFSVASGLGEVLVSPIIAELPSDNPKGDLSMLHSLYGYGVVLVVVVSTLFLHFVGNKYWMCLTLFWAVLPFISSILLMTCQLPDLNMEQAKAETSRSKHRTKGLLLCMLLIFLGASAENTMSNWISVYAENSLKMPKIWGDIFGMALFAVLLAFTRTAYAKYGKNIHKTLTISMTGAIVCYITVALSQNAIVSLLACVAVGISTSMLWPGTLILMEEKIPYAGVSAYALMAAGGDFGASFAPQSLGIIVDKLALTEWAQNVSVSLSLSAEQVGFKVGMFLATIFPILGVILLLYMKKHFKKPNKQEIKI